MTNPNNAIGTNGAFDGRTSPNALNDIAAAFTSGIVSGWNCAPKTGMTVQLGGSASVRDVALAEDNAGDKLTINNRSGAPVEITLDGAPATNNRVDAIVAYVDNPSTGDGNTTDNPTACGIIAVSGTVAANPTAPTDGQIRSAITTDGATGGVAYYVILATIRVGTNVTSIGSGVITQGAPVQSIVALADGAVTTEKLADGAVTSEKVDWSTFDYSSVNVSAVAVGTSYVTLTTIPIASDGLYFLIANLTRTSNSTSGAIVYLRFKKNSDTLRVFTAPTVPNYAGNHEPTNLGFVVFSASAGDSVTIDVMKDNNNYNSSLGTQYSLVKIA